MRRYFGESHLKAAIFQIPARFLNVIVPLYPAMAIFCDRSRKKQMSRNFGLCKLAEWSNTIFVRFEEREEDDAIKTLAGALFRLAVKDVE
jgi:hypothetical protein